MQVKDENNKWVNTSVFTEARDYFKKNGYYTPEPWGSLAWYDFWKKERHKCLHGVNIDGLEDEFEYPIVENVFMFSPEEVILKLFGLKERLKRDYLPLNARIIDITGEGVYFGIYKTRS